MHKSRGVKFSEFSRHSKWVDLDIYWPKLSPHISRIQMFSHTLWKKQEICQIRLLTPRGNQTPKVFAYSTVYMIGSLFHRRQTTTWCSCYNWGRSDSNTLQLYLLEWVIKFLVVLKGQTGNFRVIGNLGKTRTRSSKLPPALDRQALNCKMLKIQLAPSPNGSDQQIPIHNGEYYS